MVKLILILIAAFALTACDLVYTDLPTLVPIIKLTNPESKGVPPNAAPTLDESPRTGTEVDIPPTWTPEVAVDVAAPPTVVSTQEANNNTNPQTYVVKVGDTLAEIAQLFNISLENLAAANNISNVDHIEVGQTLVIPKP